MPNAGRQDLLDDCCAQALRDLFDTLDEQGVVDIRKPPDKKRRGQLKRSWREWRDGQARGEEGLSQLTWNNLGWRAAEATRGCTDVDWRVVYTHLADGYTSRAWRLKKIKWVPRTPEDHLLEQYWREHGGQIHVEAPVGGVHGPWDGRGGIRRLDGLRIATSNSAVLLPEEDRIRDALELRDGAGVEVIEVKQKLNRTVIGQTQAGQLLLCARYELEPEQVTEVVVCAKGDPALEWVCEQLGISVWTPPGDPAR